MLGVNRPYLACLMKQVKCLILPLNFIFFPFHSSLHRDGGLSSMLLPGIRAKRISFTRIIRSVSWLPYHCSCKSTFNAGLHQSLRSKISYRLLIWISRINAVSNGQVRGESYTTGCLGQRSTYGLWISYCGLWISKTFQPFPI